MCSHSFISSYQEINPCWEGLRPLKNVQQNIQLIAVTLQFKAHKADDHAHHMLWQHNLPHHAFWTPEPANTPMVNTVHNIHCTKKFPDRGNTYIDMITIS
jgi:hypothetical protein